MSQNQRPGSRPQITTKDVAPTITNNVDLSSKIKLDDIERPDLAIVTDDSLNNPVIAKYMQDLAFMEQEVTFIIAKTHDKSAPDPLILGVNGPSRTVYRGVKYTMPRKFLNSAINTFTDVNTHEYLDKDGLSQTRVETITNPSLQIQILNDPAGAVGFDWFARAQHGTY